MIDIKIINWQGTPFKAVDLNKCTEIVIFSKNVEGVKTEIVACSEEFLVLVHDVLRTKRDSLFLDCVFESIEI